MRRTVDFLCIDISSEVKKRILAFVSRFDERRDLLSYKGYYKFLYDYLSSEAKITNPISINSKGDFILGSGEIIRFKSAPQAKTLYVLLLSRRPQRNLPNRLQQSRLISQSTGHQ